MTIENEPGWPEGFWARNLVIQSNRVSECGYANKLPCAAVSARTLTGFMTTPMQKNIFLLNNVFNAVSGPALALSGVEGLVAEGNEFTSGSTSGPLVTIQYSENITLTNNLDEGRVDYR
jgi:hypothetical protein